MKISKTAVLALGWVLLTAGLGLMVVNAAGTSTPYKDLLVDLNNAVQHFNKVVFITGSSDSKVEITRIGGDPLVWIDANNFVVINSWSNENSNEGSRRNTILWWKNNKIIWTDNIWSVILWWENNTIKDSSDGDDSFQNVIAWWKGNTVENSDNSVILWWEGNTEKKSNFAVIVWSNNNIENWLNSLVVWKNNGVTKENSVAFWSNAQVNNKNSFLWSNWSYSVASANVFVVNWENGMVVGGNKAHKFAKLSVSGSLVIGGWSPSCTAWVIKKVGDCFCACDWNTRNALHWGVNCSRSCAGGTISDPVCGSDISCPDASTSYQWSCEAWQLVLGSWSHFIDKYNYLNWLCESEAGTLKLCRGDLSSAIINCNISAYAGNICGTAINSCVDWWKYVPDEADPHYPEGWKDVDDGTRYRYCKYWARVQLCDSNSFCGNEKWECVNDSTEVEGTRVYGPDYVSWICTKDGKYQNCTKMSEVQCGKWAEKTYDLNDFDLESDFFKEWLCARWKPQQRAKSEDGRRYEWKCVKETHGVTYEVACKFFLDPECGTEKWKCKIWDSSNPGGTTPTRQCTNGSETQNCALTGCVWKKPDINSHFYTWSDSLLTGNVNVTLRTRAEAQFTGVNKCSYVCDDGYILTWGVCTPCLSWTWNLSAPDTCVLGSWWYCRINSGLVYDWWLPSTAAESWEYIAPVSGVDMNITCYDERDLDMNNGWWKRKKVGGNRVQDGKKTQPEHSCIFSCNEWTYCTSVSHKVSCETPKCVVWNLGDSRYYEIWWTPEIDNENLDQIYLQMGYTFVDDASVNTKPKFQQYVSGHQRHFDHGRYVGSWGCWYRCPEDNRFVWSDGVVLCYDTWTVARLRAEAGQTWSWKCLGEDDIYGYFYIDDDSRNPIVDTWWTYAPRKTWIDWIEWLKQDGVSCLFTCDNSPDSIEEQYFKVEKEYVKTDHTGYHGYLVTGDSVYNCVPKKCGNRDIYTSLKWSQSCHSCEAWTVPSHQGELYSQFNLPISCERYTCPRGMHFNEPVKDACVSNHHTGLNCPSWSTLVSWWKCVKCIYDCEVPDLATWKCTYKPNDPNLPSYCSEYMH